VKQKWKQTRQQALALVMALTLAIPPSATQIQAQEVTIERPIRVEIDNNQVAFQDQQPTIVGGRTLVPVRGVFEHMGFNIEWFPENQMVRMRDHEGEEVLLQIGYPQFQVTGEMVDLDVPAQIINDRTMLPLRAIVEALEAQVEWNQATAEKKF